MLRNAVIFFGLILMLGCGVAIAAWPRLDSTDPAALQLRAAYGRIQTGVTSVAQLDALGLDTDGATKLSYLGVMEQFMPQDSGAFDALAPGVQSCLAAGDGCSAYIFTPAQAPGVRMVLLIQSGRVAYKKLSGMNDVAENEPAKLRMALD